MVTVPTTLILGAGASHAYKYPTGQDLIRRIVNIHLEESDVADIVNILEEENRRIFHEDVRDHVDIFKKRLRSSRAISIDSFLEVNKEDRMLLLVGKTLLLKALFAEGEILFPESDDWYKLLWNDLNSENKIDSLLKNKLSIISFNYERSLERYLKECFLSYYPNANERLPGLINWMDFKHVYGSTEKYKNSQQNVRIVHEDIENIKLYHDVINDETTEEIQEILKNSVNVYFIGFSYLKQNMKVLGKGIWNQNGAICGSCLGFTLKEIENINQEHFKKNNREPLLDKFKTMKAEQFYREMVNLG